MEKGYHVPTAWINSPQAREVAEFYTQGHSVKETAERFGVSTVQVNNLVKKRKLTNGRDFRNAANEDRRDYAEKKLSARLSGFGFVLVSQYSNKHGTVVIRCVKCGKEHERTVEYLAKADSVPICIECQKRKTQRRREEQKEAKRLTDEIYRLWNPPNPPKDAYAEQHERFLSRSGVCEICGKHYTVREYAESCGMKYARDNGVCSRECRDAKTKANKRASHRGRKDSHRHRARQYNCEYDSSVKLDRLIKRDGLRCAICGGICDLNDHTWTEYSGPLYPSIDHIIPMSKGGGHVWDNVQIAHIICNSEKGDRLEAKEA